MSYSRNDFVFENVKLIPRTISYSTKINGVLEEERREIKLILSLSIVGQS